MTSKDSIHSMVCCLRYNLQSTMAKVPCNPQQATLCADMSVQYNLYATGQAVFKDKGTTGLIWIFSPSTVTLLQHDARSLSAGLCQPWDTWSGSGSGIQMSDDVDQFRESGYAKCTLEVRESRFPDATCRPVAASPSGVAYLAVEVRTACAFLLLSAKRCLAP